MNRNQRIVVSIVGIIIVTLALIGITYAYFMTKIIGNSSETSISGTLANLELTYGDGNGVISKDNMMPGDIITKTFSVENTGSVKVDSYAVVFENLVNTLNRNEDLVYTLECKSSDSNSCKGRENIEFPLSDDPIVFNSIMPTVTHTYTLTVTYKNLDDVDQSDDMGRKFEAKVNIKDSKNYNPYTDNENSLAYKILNNSLENANNTQYRTQSITSLGHTSAFHEDVLSYTQSEYNSEMILQDHFYVRYSDDYAFDKYKGYVLKNPHVALYTDIANKSFYFDATSEYREDLENFSSEDYYTNINKYNTNGIVQVLGKDIDGEKTLGQIEDVYGTSYYYRGNVEDNYLSFANMCWRVVRIQGDGSIKLILQDSKGTCNENSDSGTNSFYYNSYGVKSGFGAPDYTGCNADSSSCMRKGFQNWYKTSGLENYQENLKEETWYLGNQSTFYDYDGQIKSDDSGERFSETYKRLYGLGTKQYVSLLDKQNGVTDYVATLTADEVILAGGAIYSGNKYFYLNAQTTWWWTLSLMGYDYYASNITFGMAFVTTMETKGLGLNTYPIYWAFPSIRPAIVLKANTNVSGEGTKTNPYVVL